MAKLKYFNGVSTVEELAKAYRIKSMELHPDTGGDAEEFKEMNEEYKNVKIALDLLPSLQPSVGEKVEKPRRKTKLAMSNKRQTAIIENFGEIGRNLAEEGIEAVLRKLFGG